MAKFFTLIVALVCLFTLSLARISPGYDDVTNRDPANEETDANSAVVNPTQFVKLTFRPINRRFPVRSKQPHHHHSEVHPVAEIKEIGNGVIECSFENSDSNNRAVHGEPQRIPSRLATLQRHRRHDHDEDSDSDSDDEDENRRTNRIAIKRRDHHRFDIEKKLKILKNLNKHFSNRNVDDHKGGFMKRLRKFLHHYLNLKL